MEQLNFYLTLRSKVEHLELRELSVLLKEQMVHGQMVTLKVGFILKARLELFKTMNR